MKRIFMVFIAVIIVSPVHAGDVMKFAYSESFAPYSWKEKTQMVGILIDIADEAVRKRMGMAVSHEGYPWKRAQHLVRRGKADALITNGQLRKEWVKFSETVLNQEFRIYVKAGGRKYERLKKISSLEELRDFDLLDHLGSGWAKKNLVEKNFKVDLANDQDTIYRMLARGRADANINCNHVARYLIKKLGLQEQIAELPVVLTHNPFSLCVGKISPYTKILPRFDEIIREMKEDGSLQNIIDNYTK